MMLPTDVLRQRLANQRLVGPPFASPAAMVQALGAVQSQDYAGARWSVGQRTAHCTDADVMRAFDRGEILRTHVLRPTWHFVDPSDIRWLGRLTAPRVHALNAYYYRQAELDPVILSRSADLLVETLADGEHRTRAELATLLGRAGIVADGLRLSLIMMYAELEELICSGALRGKQHTYALIFERAPDARHLAYDEALAALARRFFAGHGPATLRDYVRWSGLTMAEAKQGLAAVQADLACETVAGQELWFDPTLPPAPPTPLPAYLLPEYDECVLTYPALNFPDLSVVDAETAKLDTFYRPIVIGGSRAGSWRRVLVKGRATLEARLLCDLDEPQMAALRAACDRYATFPNLPVTLVILAA